MSRGCCCGSSGSIANAVTEDIILSTNVLLCDDDVANTPFIRTYRYDGLGNLLGFSDFQLDGSTPYVVGGTVTSCCLVV